MESRRNMTQFNSLAPWRSGSFLSMSFKITAAWAHALKLLSCEEINIGSGNGLVPSGNKPLPESMLTHTYGVTRPQRKYYILNITATTRQYATDTIYRADSRSSQWETSLLCNDVSHCLGANLDSALYIDCLACYTDMCHQECVNFRSLHQGKMCYRKVVCYICNIDCVIEPSCYQNQMAYSGYKT